MNNNANSDSAPERRRDVTGVVLLNMGGPDSLDAVEPFLFNLFNDNDIITLPLGGLLFQRPLARLISSRRSRFVRDYYKKIGGRSPLARITALQARLLEDRLNRGPKQGDHNGRKNVPASDRENGRQRDSAPAFRCYVAMRYWHPFTAEAIAKMQGDGVRRIVALTLYPHYTTATTESSLRELRRALCGPAQRVGDLAAAEVIEIDRFFDDPTYLDALARRVRFGLHKFPAATRSRVTILFSAHGLPVSFIAKGDPYVDHLHTTITGVIARLALTEGRLFDWRLSFQSRAGPSRWLEPSTEQALATLAAEGRREVLAVPISFVSDHVETLYEIDMLFGDEAKRLGLTMRRAPTLNGEPLFTEALAGLIERRLAPAPATPLPAATQQPPVATQKPPVATQQPPIATQ